MKQSTIVIIFCILLFLLLLTCTYVGFQQGKKYSTVDTITTLKYDTTIHIVNSTAHHFSKQIIYKENPLSAELIAFLSKQDTSIKDSTFTDTSVIVDLISDDNIEATITDTIQNNDIKSRVLQYRLLNPVAINNGIVYKDIERQRVKGFVSGFVGFKDVVNYGLLFNVLSKKESLYGVGYDLKEKKLLVSYGLKIKF